MNKAYVYKLEPTTEQETMFRKTFGCCRKVWNLMLTDKKEYYITHKKTLYVTPAAYKDEYPFLREVDSLALANVQMNLQAAYRNHYKNPSHFGWPVFKKKRKSNLSYTTNNQHDSIRMGEDFIRLPKIGNVKAIIHRRPSEDWTIKSATVSMDACGDFFVSVLFYYEAEIEEVEATPDRTLAFDYKSDGLYVDSENNICDMPKYFRQSQKNLARAQRKLSKMQEGSQNYEKQRKKVGKIQVHIANQRRDFHQKKSTEIANQYDLVLAEDLNMAAIGNKGFHLGKSTYDNGYGRFLRILEYKLAERGKHLIKVDKWYPSSQLCSSCGFCRKPKLNERTYTCPSCGLVIDRDYNAALNIKSEGLRLYHENAA